MPNIASILKSEIARVARKEVRGEVLALRKAIGVYRTEIAALKRRALALEQELRRLGRPRAKAARAEADDQPARALRFSAKGLAAQRRRLGLSAHECGLLVGVSGQSVYNWEDGKSRPGNKHLAAIAGLRSMGKRQAASQLAALRQTA